MHYLLLLFYFANDPSSADSLFTNALAHARRAEWSQAQALLEEGRQKFPKDRRFPSELAGVAYRQNRLNDTKRFLRQTLSLQPQDTYANEFLGTLYLREEDLPAALKHLNRIGQPYLQTMSFSPEPALHPVLLHRTFAFSSGQILTLRRLRETEANLDRFALPANRYDLVRRSDGRFDLTIRPFPELNRLGGGWLRLLPYLRGLPYQSLQFDALNLRSGAANLRTLLRWDREKRRIALELQGPWAQQPRRGLRVSFDARDERWQLPDSSSIFRVRTAEIGGDLLLGLNDRNEWHTGLRLAYRAFPSSSFQSGWLFEQRNRLSTLLLDRPAQRLSVRSIITLNTGRTTESFASAVGSLAAHWRPDDPWQINGSISAAATAGSLPFDRLFQLGVERDNDLWLRAHPGTKDGRKGFAPLGQRYALINTEATRRFARLAFLGLEAGPFFDAGSIGSRRYGSKGWLYDTGALARLRLGRSITFELIYGRDLKDGRNTIYTAVKPLWWGEN